MKHLLKYNIMTKFRNFSIVFWPFIFPLVLTTLMYFSIGRISEQDFEVIPAAVVCSGGKDESFTAFLKAMEADSGIIQTEEMAEADAMKALQDKEVKGIFYCGDERYLKVAANGLPESILQMILENYEAGIRTIEQIAETHPEGMEEALRHMEQYQNAVEQVSLGGKTTNGMSQMFYAMIGMACLYGCFIGFGSAMDLQANLTALAARRSAAPVNKMKLILSELITGYGIHFGNILILTAYMKYVLRLELTGSFMEMLPILFMGSIFGVTMGLFVSSIGKMGEGVKIGILIGVSMVMSFFAGMMNPEIKNVVDKANPVLSRLNPAGVISDALYCVNVYDAPVRYVQDLILLAVMCAAMILGAFLIIRRERYVSI